MRNSTGSPHPLTYENLNIKVRIDSLLFDILLDNWFVPKQLVVEPEKHNHFAIEIHFFISGSGSLFLGEQEIQINPGSIHVIGPNVYHAIKQKKDAPITRMYIQFTFKDIHIHDDFFLGQDLHKYYYMSFKQKLIETRIEVAKDLLQINDLTIQQIAEEVGYAVMRNFCKLFVGRTELTPTQYRKLHGTHNT